MSAKVHAFPLARNGTMVRNLADQMLALSEDEGEDFLLWFLGVEWDRLHEHGVDFDAIETGLLGLAAAIRAIVWRARRSREAV